MKSYLAYRTAPTAMTLSDIAIWNLFNSHTSENTARIVYS